MAITSLVKQHYATSAMLAPAASVENCTFVLGLALGFAPKAAIHDPDTSTQPWTLLHESVAVAARQPKQKVRHSALYRTQTLQDATLTTEA
jgi:hypothetical protein